MDFIAEARASGALIPDSGTELGCSLCPERNSFKNQIVQGYQGIQKLHANSQVPQKKPRKGTLSDKARKDKSGVSETTSNWGTRSSKTENI